MLVGMVDAIFMDVAQPDQARILAINAKQFLKADGFFMISIKVCHIVLLLRTGDSACHIV